MSPLVKKSSPLKVDDSMILDEDDNSVLSMFSLTQKEEQTDSLDMTESKNNERKTTSILVEIVGATNLSHPSITNLHPFVLAKLHKNGESVVVARTKSRKNCRDPIWCVEHRCLFLLNVLKDIYEEDENENFLPTKLQFEVRHKDSGYPTSCTLIGCATIPLRKVMGACNEERIELTLDKNWKGKLSVAESKLAVRFRYASELDIQIMEELTDMHKSGQYSSFKCDNHRFINTFSEGSNDRDQVVELITEMDQSAVGCSGVVNAFNNIFRKTKTGGDGVIRNRVKPYPDPKREEKTKHLSHDEMVTEMMKPSTNWIAAGKETSQSLGKVYLEILSCTDLPNMDSGESLGNKTDAFVCAVFEDSMVMTDVIDDKLSPFWFPWCQRAFVFHITHPSSPLYISVNDYDLGPGGHDGIGRVAINLSHFQSDTLYTLHYNLYPASNIPEREDKWGKITIRLRKVIIDEKKMIMAAAFKSPPRFHINMKKSQSLPVANFTCFGLHNEEKYDVKLLRSYVNEMLEMKRLFFYAVNDAVSSLIMWRGNLRVGKFWLPTNSVVAFFGGIYVVEHPHLIPGCVFLTIAGCMMASLNARMHHPDPWKRTMPFSFYLSSLMFGKSYVPLREIKAMENHDEALNYKINWETRIETDLNAVNTAWELQLEMDRIGNEDLQTEEKVVTAPDPTKLALEVLASSLFPMQTRLRRYCTFLRKIKKVTTWEEGTISFWVTLLCLITGIVLLVIPTVFLIHWICRICIWVVLGPWLRIYYELFVFDKQNPLSFQSSECRTKYARRMSQQIRDQFKEIVQVARMKGEYAIKMKSMRTFRFGKHIAKVPSMNITRHYDFPLPESTATHISSMPEYEVPKDKQMKLIPSQRLLGNMIPMTEEQMLAFHSNTKVKVCCTNDEASSHTKTDCTMIGKKVPVKEDNDPKHDAQLWFNKAITQLGFNEKEKVESPIDDIDESTQGDDKLEQNVFEDGIEIDMNDNVIHISAHNLLCNADDDSDYSSLYESMNESACEEEGLEIIVCDTGDEDDVPDEIHGDINNIKSDVTVTSLSTVYHCTDAVYVTYCRSGLSDIKI